MSNQIFKALSTGLGVGLLAATLSVSVQAELVKNSWASGMIFYKGGTTPTFLINVPTGGQTTDSTLLLEFTLADATKQTYSLNYFAGQLGTAAGEKFIFSLSNATVQHTGSITSVNSAGASQLYDLSSTNSLGSVSGVPALVGLWGGASYSSFIPGSTSHSNSFAGNISLGSGTASANCYVTFKAAASTNGNLYFVTASNTDVSASVTDVTGYSLYSSAGAASWWFPLKTATSGLALNDWTQLGTAAFTAWNAVTDGSFPQASSIYKQAYTTTVATLGTASSSNAGPITNWPSSAPTVIARINTCNGVYANRAALNNSGLILGTNNGLSRVW